MNPHDEISTSIDKLVQNGSLTGKDIYIFGVNEFAEYIANYISSSGYTLSGFLDNATEKHGIILTKIPVISPALISSDFHTSVILVASQFYGEMLKQLESFGFKEKENVFDLLPDFFKNRKFRHVFWSDGNLDKELAFLREGEECYNRLASEYPDSVMLISPTISLGDNFLWALYLDAYLKEHNIKKYVVLVPSTGAYKVVGLFTKNTRLIDKNDIDSLVDYVMFIGEKKLNALVLYPRHKSTKVLDLMASGLGWSWSEIYAPFIFELGAEAPKSLPQWVDESNLHEIFDSLGLKKGKTVVLAPYANLLAGFPDSFWEELALHLKEFGYSVCTNVAGSQTPINGTAPLSCDISKAISYLEYAGTFIGIRSGLCDVIGQAKCKQIILFRNRPQLLSTFIRFNDLHRNDIAPLAEYVIYDDLNDTETIGQIIEKLL